MRALRDRLVFGLGDAGASLRAGETPVAEVIARLEELGSPAKLIAQRGLAAADVIAALGQAALAGDDAPGPSLAQARPRSPGLLRSLTEPTWAAVFPGAPHRARLCIAAGLLQVHDFWDASHEAAQQADDLGERACSAYWHGIAHRREPDAANAAYWFRRVGKHVLFKPLAIEAQPLLEEHGDAQLTSRLTSGGGWNATAMIELCSQAKPGTPVETLLRRIQRAEMWLLLEASYAAIAA